MKTSQLKQIPLFKTDGEAENFVDTADLTDYDLTGFKPVHFKFYLKKPLNHLPILRTRRQHIFLKQPF
ncbi:CopG family antitoxin [Bartonella jaculi]|uniref:Uncharacterized protein n=1 Tax=Bartonella jaculi TaxID=686226 RepID=A0ABP9NBX4_9HYPH